MKVFVDGLFYLNKNIAEDFLKTVLNAHIIVAAKTINRERSIPITSVSDLSKEVVCKYIPFLMDEYKPQKDGVLEYAQVC